MPAAEKREHTLDASGGVGRTHRKKRKDRQGSELGRGFEVRPSIGRRSSGGRSDRIKLRSPRPTSSQPSQSGPSIHLRSGSFLRGGEPVKGLWYPSHYGARRASYARPRRCVSATEEEQRSPGTHTEVRPGVVVVVLSPKPPPPMPRPRQSRRRGQSRRPCRQSRRPSSAAPAPASSDSCPGCRLCSR